MSATPYIQFEPAWKAIAGPLIAHGRGLLSQIPVEQRDFVDEFTLLLGEFTVKVKPKQGQIWLDYQQVLQIEPSKLVWSRTMQKELQAGGDNNTAPARLLCYKVGLEDRQGKKHGWRVYEGGRMLAGIT